MDVQLAGTVEITKQVKEHVPNLFARIIRLNILSPPEEYGQAVVDVEWVIYSKVDGKRVIVGGDSTLVTGAAVDSFLNASVTGKVSGELNRLVHGYLKNKGLLPDGNIVED